MNRIGEGEERGKERMGEISAGQKPYYHNTEILSRNTAERERKACKGRRLGGEENTKTYVSQTNGIERSKTKKEKKEDDIITQVLFPPRQLYEWQWIASGH